MLSEILVRSLMANDPDDFELLYKREVDKYPSTYGISSFAYGNISFMSQIRLPEGALVSYPTMVFRMVGNVDSERQAVERVYDYMRKKLVHFTGNIDEGFKPLFVPYTVHSIPAGAGVDSLCRRSGESLIQRINHWYLPGHRAQGRTV